ncbi:hypothetical protein BDN72DRAFT_330074 [Pluteus cervinus]|uniref:Uncharacterized protein n=1 Tax=Pluteus cervinus TaxID=181527 RepID=A0ACD3AC81_9AGAR|nr:hypothetical protein BDN72DRAFT_330074 [Pluteus cervinus]
MTGLSERSVSLTIKVPPRVPRPAPASILASARPDSLSLSAAPAQSNISSTRSALSSATCSTASSAARSVSRAPSATPSCAPSATPSRAPSAAPSIASRSSAARAFATPTHTVASIAPGPLATARRGPLSPNASVIGSPPPRSKPVPRISSDLADRLLEIEDRIRTLELLADRQEGSITEIRGDANEAFIIASTVENDLKKEVRLRESAEDNIENIKGQVGAYNQMVHALDDVVTELEGKMTENEMKPKEAKEEGDEGDEVRRKARDNELNVRLLTMWFSRAEVYFF